MRPTSRGWGRWGRIIKRTWRREGEHCTGHRGGNECGERGLTIVDLATVGIWNGEEEKYVSFGRNGKRVTKIIGNRLIEKADEHLDHVCAVDNYLTNGYVDRFVTSGTSECLIVLFSLMCSVVKFVEFDSQ